MAEENQSFAPEMSEAGTPIPPIDNIHNPINSEPEMAVPNANEPPPQQSQTGEQLDIEMPEAAVRPFEGPHLFSPYTDRTPLPSLRSPLNILQCLPVWQPKPNGQQPRPGLLMVPLRSPRLCLRKLRRMERQPGGI